MNSRLKTCVAAVLLLSALSVASAAGDDAFAGFWAGDIQVPSGAIAVMVALEKGDDGSWKARIDVPSQGIRQVAMTGVSVAEGSASFAIPEVPGDPTFNGTLSEDGTSLAGTFEQGGQAIPFSMTRGEKPADYDKDFYVDFTGDGVAGKGLPGTWHGLIVAGPHKLRLVLNLSANEEGYVGSVKNLDQGGADTPIVEIAIGEDRGVTFAIPAAQSTYQGTMNESGSLIEGSWVQAGSTFDVDFRRHGE